MIISLIAAATKNLVIGKDNDLPWKLPDDMKFFQTKTKGHIVIMGRKNYDSLPPKFKPLPNRTNVILTRQEGYSTQDCLVFNSLKSALDYAREQDQEEVFVIGGGQIYAEAMDIANRIYLTEIDTELEGDTYFPEIGDNWQEIERSHHDIDERHAFAFDFVTYEKN